MTLGSYVTGAAALALMVVPLWWSAIWLRRWLFPQWSGPLGWLAEAVMALGLWLILAQALGSIEGFTRPLLVPTCVVVGTVLGLWARRTASIQTLPARKVSGEAGTKGSSKPAVRAVAAGAVVGVGTVWIIRSWWSYFGGIRTSWDSLWYHLPFAARFVQTASLTALHDIADPPSTFLPANGEVFHAIGMVALRNDALSPWWNLLWLALMLVGAWCVGVAVGRPHLTLLVGALVGAWPIFQNTQPGTANTDVAGLAFIVAAVAFLLNAEGRVSPAVLAGAALGLAVGTKLSLVPVALASLPLMAVAARRLKALLVALLALVMAGSFWYVRNLVRVGNPFPWVGARLGPLHLARIASAPIDCGTATVAKYLARTDVWTHWFLPGLRNAFGPLWWVVLFGGIGGSVLGVFRGPNAAIRMLGGAALAGIALYAVTPASAGGINGTLSCFVFNLRFLVPALTLGLFAGSLSVSPALSRPLLPALALALVVTLPASRRAGLVGVGIASAAAAIVVMGRKWPDSSTLAHVRHRGAFLAGAAIVFAAILGFPLTNRYLGLRYANSTFEEAVGAAAHWARAVGGARIGVAGFALHYPLYGLHGIDNQVDYVKLPGAGWPFRRPQSCDAWRSVLHANGYAYVVIGTWIDGQGPPRESRWTRGDQHAHEILRDGQTSVFALDAHVAPSPCSDRELRSP